MLSPAHYLLQAPLQPLSVFLLSSAMGHKQDAGGVKESVVRVFLSCSLILGKTVLAVAVSLHLQLLPCGPSSSTVALPGFW